VTTPPSLKAPEQDPQKKRKKKYMEEKKEKKERKAQWTGTTQLSMHNAHDFKPAIFFSSGNIFNAFA